MKIKICGIKNEAEVEILNHYPVSYAGFIFAKSKRQVDKNTCVELKKKLRGDIKSVGVFVDAPIEEVLDTIHVCQLDIIQLHGSETVDYIKKIPIPVWKTIPVKSKESLDRANQFLDVVEGILFETYHKELKGGTGESFDWSLVENLRLVNSKKEPVNVILAGGLKPSNIKEAANCVKPTVLDVNSGVEVDGFKTLEKIDSLFKQLQVNKD